MQRYAVGCQYDGTPYYGWQRQRDVITVAGFLEDAFSRVANHPVVVQGSGRTDRGVHAHQQIFHFDSSAVRTSTQWLRGVHTHLPASIRCRWVQPMSSDFHARFSARSRMYGYVIHHAPMASVWWHNRAWWCPHSCDFSRMHQAAQLLVGTHDFSGFRGGDCQAHSPIKTLHRVHCHTQDHVTCIVVHGDAFLHHMVRNMVGALVCVGRGQRDEAWLSEVLVSTHRHPQVPMAPAAGLYFLNACYPSHVQLPRCVTSDGLPDVIWDAMRAL